MKLQCLEDVLNNSISLKDKLEFLEELKRSASSFSEEDLNTMNEILRKEYMDVKLLILEILLKDDVEVVPKYLSDTVWDIFVCEDNPDRAIKGFLPLKVIMKSNITLGKNYGNDHFVFLPFFAPREEESNMLYDYEKYILEHLRYMVPDHLCMLFDMVEENFFTTKYEEFKPKYIEAMFYLGMHGALINIILDKNTDLNLRKEAIWESLRLLPHTDETLQNYSLFRDSFIDALVKISEDYKENVKLRELADYILVLVKQNKMSLKDYNNMSLCSKIFGK